MGSRGLILLIMFKRRTRLGKPQVHHAAVIECEYVEMNRMEERGGERGGEADTVK